MSHLRALIVVWCVGLAVAPARAQSVELPDGVPVLASSLSEGETMIDAESVGQFSTIVLPALEHVVKRGGMPLPAVRQLPFADHRELLWAGKGTRAGKANPFPFPGVGDDGEPDLAEPELALHLMQNGQALWQNPPALEASVGYYRYRDGYEPSSLHFSLIRSSTTAQQPYSASQLFRELVSFDAPPGILPLQFLTIRFSNTTGDRVWEQSGPAGVRSLEGWLRHERTAGGLFVLDDLFVHAASPAAYDYREVLAAIQLVPFSAISQPQVTEDASGCVTMTQDRQNPQFNSFLKRFARANGWVPTELVFVPRRVFVIKAVPKSPYPVEAEITIVVDRSTMFPVMKVVRSDSGSLLRVVLGGFTLVRTKEGFVVPFIRQVVSISGGAGEVDALSFEEVRRCGSERAIELRSQLDTRHLLKGVTGAEEQSAPQAPDKEGQSGDKGSTVTKGQPPSKKKAQSRTSPSRRASLPQESPKSERDEEGVD